MARGSAGRWSGQGLSESQKDLENPETFQWQVLI